jgi:hypothetical protein
MTSSMASRDRFNWLVFTSKGSLFVTMATFIGTLGHFFIPGTTGDLAFIDQVRVSAIAAMYALGFSILPAIAGYFLLRMIRRLPRRTFITWSAVLGLLLGIATLSLAPPATVFLTSLLGKHSFSQWASLLAFPIIPLTASVVFFVLIGLRHAKDS